METKTAIPQPGETWQHRHLGPVKVITRWNHKECVCEGERPGVGTRILHDCFLTRPATQAEQGLGSTVRDNTPT